MIEFTLAVVSMGLNALGMLFLKWGINKASFSEVLDFKEYFSLFFKALKQWPFLLGGCCYVMGWAARIIAVSIADLTFVRTVYVTHVVFIAIGSHLFLKALTEFNSSGPATST